MGRRRSPLGIALVLVLAAGATAVCRPVPAEEGAARAPERLRVKVLQAYPHDPKAFTQGLLWHEGKLYESTGQYGSSQIRRVDPTSGRVEHIEPLDDGLFGEGLARVGDRLIQLTWQAGLALVYDLRSLAWIDQRDYSGEGWGLAYDGRRLVMSDGSSRLTFRDAESFKVLGSIEVTLEGRSLENLNELEAVGGAIYANVWQTDLIVRIDPADGRVTATVQAGGLLSPMRRGGAGVLNGIAWDPDSETFWLTGKHWPQIFQVVFEPATR